MKQIEITKENYEAYDEFFKLKNGVYSGKYEKYFMFGLSTFATILCIPALILTILGASDVYLMFLIMIYAIIMKPLLNTCTDSLPILLSIRGFKKEHPDFDMNIDIEELEKELVKYKELSVIPKDIEVKKEEHLSIDNNNFKEMSTEEKLEFLEKEKEFWKQVQTQEKYSNSNDNKKEVQKTRKIEF